MSEFQKRYIVPETVFARTLVDLHRSVMTFNHRKFGRNARGTVMLTAFSSDRLDSGMWAIVVTFATHQRPLRIHIAGHPPLRLFMCSDFRKTLRKLATADTQRRNRKPAICRT